MTKSVTMESRHSDLFFIIDKFPEHIEQITELYKSDPHFKDLCSDYLLCLNMLNKYRNESIDHHDIIKEYENVQMDLEKEMQDFIYNKK